MIGSRHLCAALGLSVLLAAGSAFAGSRVTVDTSPDTTGGPEVEIVVYDGTALPATTVAGCSEPDCMGYAGPLTGSVTHAKNYIGWSVAGGDPRGRIYLYVDEQYSSSARSGRLLTWSTASLAASPHTLEAMVYDSAKVEGWSTPLSISLVK